MDNNNDALPHSLNKMYIYSKFQLRIISLLECMDIDILMILKNHEILFANTAFIHTLGLSIDDVIGNNCDTIRVKNPDSYRLPYITCPIDRIIASLKPLVITDSYIDETGSKKIINVIGSLTKIGDTDEACLYMTVPVQKISNDENESERALLKGYKLIDMLAQIHYQEYKIYSILNELEVTKENLIAKTSEFNLIYKNIVDRELKMIELKKQISQMQSQLTQIGKNS